RCRSGGHRSHRSNTRQLHPGRRGCSGEPGRDRRAHRFPRVRQDDGAVRGSRRRVQRALVGVRVGRGGGPLAMADDAQIEVQGLNKLTRALKKAGVEIKDLKDANQRVGNVVVQASGPITPHRTGALASSLRVAQRQSGVIVRAGGGRIRYAKYVEYGTRKMGARSYLVKGAQDSQPRWMTEYENELQKVMD